MPISLLPLRFLSVFFFFNDSASTEIYTLSLHDALPILRQLELPQDRLGVRGELLVRLVGPRRMHDLHQLDRKSTRLNSSHTVISYAVFCLKKKKKRNTCTPLAAHAHRQDTPSSEHRRPH